MNVVRRSATWHRHSQQFNWVTVLWNSVSPTTASTDHRTGIRTSWGRDADHHVCRRSRPIVFTRGHPIARNWARRRRHSSRDFSHEQHGQRCRTPDRRVTKNFDWGPEIRRQHSFERLCGTFLGFARSRIMSHVSNFHVLVGSVSVDAEMNGPLLQKSGGLIIKCEDCK